MIAELRFKLRAGAKAAGSAGSYSSVSSDGLEPMDVLRRLDYVLHHKDCRHLTWLHRVASVTILYFGIEEYTHRGSLHQALMHKMRHVIIFINSTIEKLNLQSF